jgi:2-polyprenyl-3-methyl-5-hydroxy-6-metoxy-1,4-benzoquinol methylase
LRILDVASGGGDVVRGLWHRARRAGLEVDICGVDVSPRAVEFAQTRADRIGVAVRFSVRDVLGGELPDDFDVVISSLFLHHLDKEAAIGLLVRMGAAARRRVLVNDLVRSRRGLILAHMAARLLTASRVVWVDAPRSVRAAFTLEEVRDLTRVSGLRRATVSPRWPCRMLLDWNHP